VHQHLQTCSRRTVRNGHKKEGFGAVGWRKLGAAALEPVPAHAAAARFGIECLASKCFPEEVSVRRIGDHLKEAEEGRAGAKLDFTLCPAPAP
jgi:hypothetical protein